MPPAAGPAHEIDAQLAFARIEDVSVDDPRRGLRRARTFDPAVRADPRSYDRRTCRITDCSAPGAARPDLREHGFTHIDLSSRRGLQAALERVRAAGRLDPADAAEIRGQLSGRSLALPGGGRLWLLHLAREGFFMRRAGPNGMALQREAAPPGLNDHDAAVAVHADQDVEGTPLRQMLGGAAPWLFRHESPDRRNRLSRLTLVNLWIPLEQVTRPLALMDRRTLDRRAHQLRHGLVTDRILQRDEDRRINDVWLFLHDPAQRWYFTSEMQANTAYAFETLGTPHGSFIVPGEELAEVRYRQLTAAVEAVRRGDEAAAILSLADDRGGERREPATASLRRAIAAMESLLAEGREQVAALCRAGEAADWCARATVAAERVVRKSLEMRALALITPALRAPWRRSPA